MPRRGNLMIDLHGKTHPFPNRHCDADRRKQSTDSVFAVGILQMDHFVAITSRDDDNRLKNK